MAGAINEKRLAVLVYKLAAHLWGFMESLFVPSGFFYVMGTTQAEQSIITSLCVTSPLEAEPWCFL